MVSLLMKMPPEVRRTLFTGDKLNGLCEMGFTDEQLASLDIGGSCTRAGGATMAAVPECDCRCAVYEQMWTMRWPVPRERL